MTCRMIVDLRQAERDPMRALRMLLVADLMRRFLEDLGDRCVLLAVLEHRVTLPEAETFWIRSPTTRAASAEEADGLLGGAATVRIQPTGQRAAVPGAQVVQVGAVAGPAHADSTVAAMLGDHEPLALRLALLRFRHASPAALTPARLHRAAETIRRWRYKVAMWADMPSAPAVAADVAEVRRALAANLDTVTVLTRLHRLEVDPLVPSGSKFETFAYLDRVLALDLCHLVGKLRR